MKRTFIVLGALALGLSIAGGAWAGSKYLITSPHQVKPGTLTGTDIKNGSIGLDELTNHAKAKLKGQRGPVGPPGPARSDRC